jgi:hypothetical protein
LSTVKRFIAGRFGPTAVALVLGLIAWPIVSLSLAGPSEWASESSSLELAFLASLGAVVAGALVGGTVGGRRWRRRPISAGILAIVTAWPAAIIAFPIIPTALGLAFRFGHRCADGCSPILVVRGGQTIALLGIFTADSVPSAVKVMAIQYVGSLVVGGVAFGVPAILVGALAFFTSRSPLRTSRRRRLTAVLAFLAVASLNTFSIGAVTFPFVALVLGVLIWGGVLSWAHRGPGSAHDRGVGRPPPRPKVGLSRLR